MTVSGHGDVVAGQHPAPLPCPVSFAFAAGLVAEGVDPASLRQGDEVLIVNGVGSFDGAGIRGQGGFNHLAASAVQPFSTIATGTWKATDVYGWRPGGGCGVLHLDITLRGDFGEPFDGRLQLSGHLAGTKPGSVRLALPGGRSFGPEGLFADIMFSTGVEGRP